MTDSSTIRRRSRANILAAAAGYFAMGVGVLVLVGWWWRIDFLKRVGEGMITMNPLTALCCLLAGISLVMQVRRPVSLARVLAAVVITIGSLKLGGYLLAWNIPLDQRLFGVASYVPMALHTAVTLLVLGIGISGFARALEEREAGKLDPTSLGYLHRIRKAAAFMGELIDDLLQLSRLTRADMSLEPVNLSEMAHDLIAEHRLAEPERRVEVVIAPDIMVMGDPALLRAMMDNLLGNAWKFTSRKPEARIELGAGSVYDGKLWCFIRDNGVGFDNRYAHKLFGAFQRLHSQAEFKGTGIGLATVQRIIRRHGGEVSGDGGIDEGATFKFALDPVTTGTNP